jgi:DNA-directed RNA polymerase subunit omega
MKNDVDFKDLLTNEQLLKRFKNQFDLVRYAISLAENNIRAGREPDVWTDSQNVAYQILAEIAAHKEHFVEVPEAEEPEQVNSKEAPQSWSDDVRSFKEDKKERKPRAKAAR